MITLKNTVAAALMVAATFLFYSCENSPEDIEKIAGDASLKPLTSQINVKYEYSDSAYKKLVVLAPEALDYSHAENPYQEFPKGIDVTFFDKFGNQDSHLRANYAKRLLKDNQWQARGDVQVTNIKGEKLSTEHLIWDVEKEIIRSDEFVRIVSGDEVIMGEGFEADQNFTSYKIFRNVSGEILIPENKND